jgi:hypothetical protein
MNKKTAIWIGVYALIGYGAYYMLFSKSANIKKIISSGASTGTPEQLSQFDAGFIREWARAAKSGNTSFMYKQKSYFTKGGRAVK